MAKLSPAQERMMDSARTINHAQNAPGLVAIPFGNGTSHSAWYRTAASLARKGLLLRVGSACYTLSGFEEMPGYWEMWHALTEPQQRLLTGRPSKARPPRPAPHSPALWNDDGSLTEIGAEVAWRGLNWYGAKESADA